MAGRMSGCPVPFNAAMEAVETFPFAPPFHGGRDLAGHCPLLEQTGPSMAHRPGAGGREVSPWPLAGRLALESLRG
jgi:hypothetical protein